MLLAGGAGLHRGGHLVVPGLPAAALPAVIGVAMLLHVHEVVGPQPVEGEAPPLVTQLLLRACRPLQG